MSALQKHFHDWPKGECHGGKDCIGWCRVNKTFDGVTAFCPNPARTPGQCQHHAGFGRRRENRPPCAEKHDWDDNGDCRRCPLNIKS